MLDFPSFERRVEALERGSWGLLLPMTKIRAGRELRGASMAVPFLESRSKRLVVVDILEGWKWLWFNSGGEYRMGAT